MWMIELLFLLLIPLLVNESILGINLYIYYILTLTYVLSGNILNFNVGASVDLDIPRSFWSRLAGKYGNMFYWKEKVNLLLRV